MLRNKHPVGAQGRQGISLKPDRQASEQHTERNINPGKATAGAFVSEPLEHSVLKVDLGGRPVEGVLVLEPLEHSVLDVSLDGGPTECDLVLKPLEHSVSEGSTSSGRVRFGTVRAFGSGPRTERWCCFI